MFYKAAILASWCVVILGAAPASIPDGVVTIRTELGDAVNGRIQLGMSIRNDSSKTITAFTWVVEGTYADGSVHSHTGTVDVISDLLLNQDVFRPGVTRSFQDTLPVGPHSDKPTSAVTHLTIVVFDDDSAVGDRLVIGRFQSGRGSMAAQEAEELDQIQKALRAAAPKDAIRELIKEREAKGQGGITIQQILALLESRASAEVVQAVQAPLRAHQGLLATHATLTAVSQ